MTLILISSVSNITPKCGASFTMINSLGTPDRAQPCTQMFFNGIVVVRHIAMQNGALREQIDNRVCL